MVAGMANSSMATRLSTLRVRMDMTPNPICTSPRRTMVTGLMLGGDVALDADSCAMPGVLASLSALPVQANPSPASVPRAGV